MMLVNIEVALNRAAQIEKAVLAKRAQHVVEKSNWISHIANSASVQIQRQRNLRFASFPFDSCDSIFFTFHFFPRRLQNQHISTQVSRYVFHLITLRSSYSTMSVAPSDLSVGKSCGTSLF